MNLPLAPWPTHAAAIKELFEDHIDSRDAAQMHAALRRISSAALE